MTLSSLSIRIREALMRIETVEILSGMLSCLAYQSLRLVELS